MLLSVLLLLLRLLPRATPLLHGTTASSGPPDASSVNCEKDCVPTNGDCRRFEHCQHCRTCYPDEVPLRLVSSGGRLHVSWEHGEEFFVKGAQPARSRYLCRRTPAGHSLAARRLHAHRGAGVNWSGSEAELSVPEGLQHRSMDELLDFVADNGFNASTPRVGSNCGLAQQQKLGNS